MGILNSNQPHIPISYNQKRILKRLKQGIWLYFWLLIFEGALRKWVLPSLSTPLLIVRDPVAIITSIIAFKYGFLRINGYIITSFFVTSFAFIIALLFGHGNIAVALYGARIMIVQFPFLFVIGQVFLLTDVIKVGKTILWLALPMTVLIAFQFYSPQNAWVNHGVGGDVRGAGFSGALGYFRPPATFSFISGVVYFYGLLATFLIYFWIEKFHTENRLLLILSTICLLVALPLSISRTLFFSCLVIFGFSIIATFRKPKFLWRTIFIMIIGIILLYLLSNFELFETATSAFTSRFESATEVEGGIKSSLLNRFMGGGIDAILNAGGDYLLWGHGLGLGTNAGAMLMTGNVSFIISEGEWGRLIGEMGLLVGLFVIFIRLRLLFELSFLSYKALQMGNFLPWLLLGYGFISILQGQWSQPTSQGFSVLAGGLILASLKAFK